MEPENILINGVPARMIGGALLRNLSNKSAILERE